MSGRGASKWALLIALLAVLAVFVATALAIAARKPMWFDEASTWDNSVKVPALHTLRHGALHQVNPAPLDYLILRALYVSRVHVRYLGLHPLQYFRVHYALLASLLALWLFGIVLREDGVPGAALLLAALIPFLFHGPVFSFMSEMRPYGLWVVASLGVIFTFERAERHPVAWSVSVAGLALTATASLLQLVAMAASLVMAGMLVERRLDVALLKDRRVLVLLAGVGVSAYYARIGQELEHVPWQASWSSFFGPWSSSIPWLALGSVLSVYHVRQRRGARAASCLAATSWLALGPIMFFLIRRAGYFFTPRQLLFMQSAVALLTFDALRTGWEVLRPRRALLATATAMAGGLLLARLWLNAPSEWRTLQRPPEPMNLELLASRIPHQLPQGYRLLELDTSAPTSTGGWWTAHDINLCGRVNFEIWWDYLAAIYPPAAYPRDAGSTLVAGFYDARGLCQVPCVGIALVDVERGD